MMLRIYTRFNFVRNKSKKNNMRKIESSLLVLLFMMQMYSKTFNYATNRQKMFNLFTFKLFLCKF